MTRLRRSAALALAGLLVAAGCARTVDGSATPVAGVTVGSTATSDSSATGATTTSTGSGSEGSATSTSGSGSGSAGSATSSSGASTAGSSVATSEFAERIAAGNAKVTSMIGEISFDVSGTTARGAFSETVSNSKITGIDMSLHLNVAGQAITIRLLLTGGKVYLANDQILQQLGASGKKWALASPTSSNSTLRTLATELNGYLDSSGTDQYLVYSKAANSVTAEGDEMVNGSVAHKYELVVDIEKAAQASTGEQRKSLQQLAAQGTTELPVQLWLDDQNRIVQAENTVTVNGVTAKTHFAVSSYNSEVTIAAPDPSTVYKG